MHNEACEGADIRIKGANRKRRGTDRDMHDSVSPLLALNAPKGCKAPLGRGLAGFGLRGSSNGAACKAIGAMRPATSDTASAKLARRAEVALVLSTLDGFPSVLCM